MKAIKKIIAAVLAVAMIVSTLQISNYSANETKAAVAGITNGGIYQIVSAYNDKAITQTDFSTFYANAVVWNNSTKSDTAKWRLQERDSFYSMTNIVSGKSMKICGTNNGSTCDFNGYDNSNNYKWTLEPISGGTYNGCFYISSAVKDGNGNKLYAQITADEGSRNYDGAQINLNNKIDNEARQIWKLVPASETDTVFTESMRDTMLNAFKNRYYKYNGDTGQNRLGGGFWGIAEVMEAMLDGYETTGIADYKTMFQTTYADFTHSKRNGTDWGWNGYNDDITWASIASVRAYLLFGDENYLTIAKNNFKTMYDRASTFGNGLLRWCEEEDKRGSSNGCINGPAIVCACYLGIATGDNSYWEKAKTVYMAQRNSNLYVESGNDAGRVHDCIDANNKILNNWSSTYNQATYLGGALMLYSHYGDNMYKTDAENIYNYTVNHLCYNNILKDESTNTGDLSGFRGILPRYIRHYITDLQKDDQLKWFKDNARMAWMNRNSANLSQCAWQQKTSENVTWDEFAGYNSISLMANMPTYKNTIYKDAFTKIEAEDLDYCKGLISEGSSGTSNGRSLGGVTNGCISAYYNIKFGSKGANKINIKYSKHPDDNNGAIEVRLDSPTGTVLGTVNLANTQNWSDWTLGSGNISRVTGTHNIYLIYKASRGYVCNMDYLSFEDASEPTKSDAVNVYGFQINPTIGGFGVDASIEPKINDFNVVARGVIFGLVSTEYMNTGITANDLYKGNTNQYVYTTTSTDLGISSTKFGSSNSATYYRMSMEFGADNHVAYNAKYMVRAYALLENGTCVYSDPFTTSVYDIADNLYKNKKMSSASGHNYLYDHILKPCNQSYGAIGY